MTASASALEESLIRYAEETLYALKQLLEMDFEKARSVSRVLYLKGQTYCEPALFDGSGLSESGMDKLISLYWEFEALKPEDTYETTQNSR